MKASDQPKKAVNKNDPIPQLITVLSKDKNDVPEVG